MPSLTVNAKQKQLVVDEESEQQQANNPLMPQDFTVNDQSIDTYY